MLKDITLGQFFPGDTLAHKLDPRTKLLVTVLYVVALFTAKSYIAYGVLILTLIVAVRISRVGAKALFKGLKPVLFIIAFTEQFIEMPDGHIHIIRICIRRLGVYGLFQFIVFL